MADRTVLVRLRAQVSDFNRGMAEARRAVRGLHDEIDKTNDRTAWLAQSILALTPAVTTLGAGAVPVISGLATQLVLTAGAAGTMALAFNGVGDSLGALNDYQLDPTAENLEKLNEELGKIGPQGEEFVRFLDSVGPAFSGLAMTSRAGIFPGVTKGIEEFMVLMPQLQDVVRETAEAIGELGADTGAGLAGPKWEGFFNYLETDAKRILVEMGHTLGNFITGLANMMVAFGPLTADFSSGFEEMSQSFADWSMNLESSTGFQQFLDYVQEAGPLALDFLGSASMAFVELIEAAAPIGTIMLPALTALVDIIGGLANTPLGPLILGFVALTSAWGRLNAIATITGSGAMGKATKGIRDNAAAVKVASRSVSGSLDTMLATWATAGARSERESKRMSDSAKTAGRGMVRMGLSAAPVAGQLALLGAATSGLAGKAGLANTASLALAGSLMGPWGAAVGGAIGLSMDFAGANNDLFESLEQLREGLDDLDGQTASSAQLEGLSMQADAAQEKLNDLADTLNTGQTGSLSGILTGAKNSVEGLFGRDDYEEAYYEFEELEKRRLAAILKSKDAAASAAGDKTYYNSLQAETQALEENINKMRAKREEALRGFSAETNYAQAILDAKEAFKENGKTLDLNTEAGLNNRRALEGIASAFNQLTDKQKNAKGAFRDAKKTLYDQAIQFGATDKEARRYVRTLLEIPPKAETKIVLENDAALRKLNGLRAQLAAITANPYYIKMGIRAPNLDGFGAQVGNSADGSTIPDAPGPYRDQFIYALAPREEVVSNRVGQADRYRPVLKAINADMPPSVIKGMLADGGTATGWGVHAGRQFATAAMSGASAYSVGGGIDYERLIGGLAREFRGAADDANEVVGRAIARESGRGWTEQSRQRRAASMGGRPV